MSIEPLNAFPVPNPGEDYENWDRVFLEETNKKIVRVLREQGYVVLTDEEQQSLVGFMWAIAKTFPDRHLIVDFMHELTNYEE